MLPGAKIKTVFTSRWKALYWSAGVLLTAYCTVPAPEPDAGTPAQTAASNEKVAEPKPPKYNKWDRPTPAQIYAKHPKAQGPITDALDAPVTQRDVSALMAQ